MLFELELVRPAVLDCVAQPMQRPDARVPAPGKDQLGAATHPDPLIVDEIGRHPDQSQSLTALTDDLVAGGMRNEMGEALQGDRVAILDSRFYGFGERGNPRHSE